MKAIVLGAGIVGITTAYELNREGHDVTVIDREALPASFTSYGNAGLFAPAHSYAWSSPAAPKRSASSSTISSTTSRRRSCSGGSSPGAPRAARVRAWTSI